MPRCATSGCQWVRRLACRYTGQTDGCAGDIWMRSKWADVNQNGQRRGAGLHAHHVLPPIRCDAHTGTGCGANGCAAEPLQRTLGRVLAWGPGWSHGRAALSPIHKPPMVTPAAAQLPRERPCCPAAHTCTWHAIQPGQLCRQACRHVPPSATTGWPPGRPTGTQRLPAGACGLRCTCLTGYLARALPHPTTHPDVTSARVEEHNVTTRTSAVGQVPAGPRAGGPRLHPSQAWGPRHTPNTGPSALLRQLCAAGGRPAQCERPAQLHDHSACMHLADSRIQGPRRHTEWRPGLPYNPAWGDCCH
jgi:hypothetical protein